MPVLELTLNAQKVSVDYEHGASLLEMLRESCGLTAAKDGCSPQGFCGCCTVLVDGKPALACLTKAERVAGREVTTLEGLPERQRRTLAQAFVREGAVQCGFCTPGITVRAASLLEKGQADDPDRVRRALRGHLCRCTGYQRIVDAIVTAGEAWSAGSEVASGPPRRGSFWPPGGQATADAMRPNGVGDPVERLGGVSQVLGEKPFVADLKVEDMLHAALVLSDHPRAVVQSIDVGGAESSHGVERILLADDIPGERFIGLIEHDWPVLVAVGETTRYVGDVLAVVVADSQLHARLAADKVSVEYDVLEPVTDPFEAQKAGAPKVHDSDNLLEVCAYRRGDVDAALAEAEHVIEERFETQRIEHAFLEPEACLVIPQHGGLKVYSQGQGVHDDRRQIAAILGLDETDIEVELV